MRIVLCYPLQQRHLDQIHSAAPDAEIVNAGQERIAEEILTADVFCGHPKVPTPWDEVCRRNRLKWIQSSAAGLDHLLLPCVVESPIVVTNISGVLGNQVSEQAMALLLGLIRSLPTFFRASRRRNTSAGRFATCTEASWELPGWAAWVGAWPRFSARSRRKFWRRTCFPSISRHTSTSFGRQIGSTNSCRWSISSFSACR